MRSSLKARYIIGIAIAITVIVTNQIFIQYWLHKKTDDAQIINIAGRQRMLSQLINLEFERFYRNPSYAGDLKSNIEKWSNAHDGLLNGNDALGLAPVQDAQARILLNEVTSNINYAAHRANQISKLDASQLNAIHANQSSFLQKMERIVLLLEKDSKDKLNFIILMEIILAMGSVLVILCEVLYIFKPIERRFVKHINELETANKKFKEIAWEQSHKVRRPLSNILGLSEQLSRAHNSLNKKDEDFYIASINSEAKHLDDVLKSIVEKTIKEVDN